MDDFAQDTALIQALVEYAGTNPAAVAKRAGVAVTTVNRPYNGSATNRLGRSVLEKLQAAYPDFPGWRSVSTLGEKRLAFHGAVSAPAISDDSLVIPMLELAYGMGGTFLDGVDPGESLERFPRAFVRMFTSAPASQLCWSHGIGDSMYPTIGDRDVLLIDRSRDTIRVNDQVWVLSVSGIGMVKRVRVEANGKVVLLSDNEHVPEYPVGEDELTVIGRVIAVVKNI